MVLTMKTDMGAFQFDLMQGDIIYLLNYAQTHEGKPATVGQENVLKSLGGFSTETPVQVGAGTPPADDVMDKWAKDKLSLKPERDKYSGFLLIRCEECGELRGFCAKSPTDIFICKECGHQTPLSNLRPIFMDCECGRHYKYMTNETADVLTHTCLDCGCEVDMMLNSRKTAYITVQDPRLERNTKIRTIGSRW